VSIFPRESRRIVGEYTLPLEAVEKGLSYDDAVAIGMYHIDIHGPDVIDSGRWDTLPYDIPYRCLLAKGVDNLLAAGRNISSSFEAQASLRAVPVCFATGQAAGTAAALSVKQGVTPKALDVKLLQETLISQGAKILRIVPRHVTDVYKWGSIRRRHQSRT